MASHNEQLAQRVVETFKNVISDEAREHLSEKDYKELAQIIREALSIELVEAAEKVEGVARQLRAMTEQQDMSL